jgi:hypothetical protein
MGKGDLSNRERKKESSKHKGDKSIYSSKHIRQTLNNSKNNQNNQYNQNNQNKKNVT